MSLELRGKLNLDGSGFFGVIKQAESVAHGFADGLKHKVAGILPGGILPGAADFASSLGHGIEEKLHKMVEEVEELAHQLKYLHYETGLGYEELQIYGAAAQKVGRTLEDVTSMFVKFRKERAAAIAGGADSEAAQAFQRLGVTFQELRTQAPNETFRQLLSHFRELHDQTLAANDVTKVFGKSAGTMYGFMQQDLAEVEKKMRELNRLIGDETIVEINQAGAAWKNLWSSLKPEAAGFLAVMLQLRNSFAAGFLTGEYAIAEKLWNLVHMIAAGLRESAVLFKLVTGQISTQEADAALAKIQAHREAEDKRVAAVADKERKAREEALAKSFTVEKDHGAETAAAINDAATGGVDDGPMSKQRSYQSLLDQLARKRLANELALLSPAEQLARLRAEEANKLDDIAAQQERIAKLGDKVTLADKEKLAKLQLEDEELKAQMQAAEKRGDKPGRTFSADREAVDSFRRIGLIQGGTASNQAEQHTRQIVTAINANRTSIDKCEQEIKSMIATVQNLV